MNTTPDSSAEAAGRLATSPATPPLVVPVIEERAVIRREVVETGRVRLSKTVQEQEQAVDLTLLHEEVQVERVPINQYVADDASAPTVRYEGDTLVVPVVREVLVKRLLVVEELRVTKQQVETQHTQRVTLRHEQIDITRTSTDSPEASISPDSQFPTL